MKNELHYCRACGHEVAKSAKRCPNCGAKQKSGHPIIKAIVIILVVAILAFAGLTAIAIISATKADTKQSQSISYSESTKSTKETTKTTENAKTEKETTKTTEELKTSNDIRPEFKEMMDSYEDFFKEYCDFMEKFQKDPSNITLIGKYATMLTEYAEMIDSMDKVDQSELTDAELLYYLEVTARIEQMLAKVALSAQ